MALATPFSALLRGVPLFLIVTIAIAQPRSSVQVSGPIIDPRPIILPAKSPRSSKVQGLSFDECPCSPSSRGHPPLTLPDVKKYVELLRELEATPKNSLRSPVLSNKLKRLTFKLFEKFNLEGFVNMQAALRAKYPKLRLLCLHDLKSGRNLVKTPTGQLVSTQSCDQEPKTASTPAQIRTFVPSPGPSPAPSPLPNSATGNGRDPRVILPGTPRSANATEMSSSTGTPVPTAPPPNSPTPTPEPVDEGCVAAEHLVGHAVQHRTHLQRAVLCSRGFCATPNHAVIVDGVWTSMKKLCAEGWRCTKDVRLVNNLKISGRTRLRFDDRIVITPYDLRFPIGVSWFVQIAEDVVEIICFALATAFCIVTALAAYYGASVLKPVSSATRQVAKTKSMSSADSVPPFCRRKTYRTCAENTCNPLCAVEC